MHTEYNDYPGLAHTASQLSSFAFSINTFVLFLTDGRIVNFRPEDADGFKNWLNLHRIQDVGTDNDFSIIAPCLTTNKENKPGKGAIVIAVIDDYAPLREEICLLLEKAGMEILFQAENGEEGLEKVAASAKIPDVCLLDTNMPVMDGFTTAQLLNKKYPQVKILAYSANSDEQNIIKMFRSGACGYVVKGHEPDELQYAIETLYKDGCYINAEVGKVVLKYLYKSEV